MYVTCRLIPSVCNLPPFCNTSQVSDQEFEQLETQFQDLEVKRLYHPDPSSAKPSPPDLRYEERNVSNQFSVASGRLYEWNIDGLSEQEILNKIQHMTMVANNYLDESRPHKEVIEMMVLGFTGKLQQWWNNCLTEASKEDIKYAIQQDEEGNPIINEIEYPKVP